MFSHERLIQSTKYQQMNTKYWVIGINMWMVKVNEPIFLLLSMANEYLVLITWY